MRYLLLGLLFSVFLYACNKDQQKQLLEQAQKIVDDNPERALAILDSIYSPTDMGKNAYMRYIVTKMQAKFKTYQNISQDTLILQAADYFDDKNNSEWSALAHFYASSLYYERNDQNRELTHSKFAAHYAKEADNFPLAAKSYHTVARIYYHKEMQDSAILNYKKAYDFHLINENISKEYILDALRFCGFNYHVKKELDSAICYFNKGLLKAKEYKDKKYETTFIYLLGLSFRDKKDYKKASSYLNRVYKETKDGDERFRTGMGLLKLYSRTNQTDSASYFAKALEKELPKVKFRHTQQEVYDALSTHYTNVKNFEKAFRYAKQLLAVNSEIADINNKRKQAEAEYMYSMALHEKELEKQELLKNLIWMSIIALLVLAMVVIGSRARILNQKRKQIKERHRMLEDRMKVQSALVVQQAESLSYMQSIYGTIVNEWVGIDETVKELQREFGTTEEPEIFVRMKQMVENFKANTNKQFIKQAKIHLEKQPHGKEILPTMDDKELLLFMLYYCGYKRADVAILLDVNPHKNNMTYRKLGLKNKLIEIGMPDDEAERILFSEDQ